MTTAWWSEWLGFMVESVHSLKTPTGPEGCAQTWAFCGSHANLGIQGSHGSIAQACLLLSSVTCKAQTVSASGNWIDPPDATSKLMIKAPWASLTIYLAFSKTHLLSHLSLSIV